MKDYSYLSGFDIKSYGSNNNNNKSVNKFTPKHVLSLKNNPFSGITLYPWLQILYKYGKYIELKYILRAVFISLLSIFNTFLFIIEYIFYEKRINGIQLPDEVIFVLGHPRTGTTLIHNLLATDNDNFYYCNTFHAGFPSSFIWFEKYGQILFRSVIDKTRPMDNMPLSFDLPQEDELATTLLSGGISYYMPLYFMSQEPLFRKFLSFDEKLGCTNDEKNKWINSFTYLLKKIILKEMINGNDISKKKLVIKSPVHTGRVELLRQLFPKAKFIYLHRHPYEVLQSAVHMADTTYWYSYLNTPTNEQISEFIYWQFQEMFSNYNKAVVTKQSKSYRQLHVDTIEVSYEELVSNTLDTIKTIYSHIDIEFREKHFTTQIKYLESYRKNVHTNLSNEQKDIIHNRWSDYFNTFKYNKY